MDKILSPIKQRIIEYLDYKEITKESFYRESGLSASNFKGKALYSEIGGEALVKILSLYDDLNADWLIRGYGDMLKEYKPAKRSDQIQYDSQNLLQEPINSYISDEIISIPIVDVSAAAGHGFFNHDHPETLGELKFPIYMLRKKTGNYYCGRVNGESMSPTLLNQDFMIMRLLSFDEWADLKDNEIYFIVDRSGTSFVKRIKNKLREEGIITCMSDNTDKANFRDFSVQAEDFANIYHVEWRFSKDMTNINNTYSNRLETIESDVESIKQILNKRGRV